MKKFKIIFSIAFVFIYIIIFNLNNINKQNQINIELNDSIEDLRLHYDITRYYNTQTANSMASTLSKNKKIMNILKESVDADEKKKIQLRAQLFNILKEKFEALKLEGVKVILFATRDNKTFLRMHRPDKFGDDLSSVRHSIVKVNKTKKSLHGFEQGKVSHGFRNVYPLFDENNRYVGVFDISFSSDSMQKILDDVNKIHSHFLVKKDVVGKKVWESVDYNSEYYQSIEHRKYLISEVKEVNHIKIDISKETIQKNKKYIDINMKKAKEFAILGVRDDDLIVISFLPIRNIINKSKADAYIVSYTYNEEISKILNYYKWFNISSFFVLMIIMYLLYKQFVHKRELSKEVKKKTKELHTLNENLEIEIEKETSKNREKDKQLYEHAKNAQMGEMIGNIAHQWRQPLSLISTIASGQKLKLELGINDKSESIKDLELLNDTAQHLSETIDIFRDYIKDNKELRKVVLQDRIDYSITIVEASLSNKHIKLINNIDYDSKVELEIVLGELSQVLINIFNNAKDAFEEKDILDKWIKIALEENDGIALITIEDNAGGVPQEVISKVFDPYFTTKHQSQGTGIGLYMSAQIVQNHLHGKIYVKNTQDGAKFFIELPLIK